MEKYEIVTPEERKQFLLLDNNSFAASHLKTFLWTPTM